MEVQVGKFKHYGRLALATMYIVLLVCLLLVSCLVQGVLTLLLGLAVFRNPKLYWEELEEVTGLVDTLKYFATLENLQKIYKGE